LKIVEKVVMYKIERRGGRARRGREVGPKIVH